MYHQILRIFMFLALSLFSSATESKAERLIYCYKYEKKFPDVNIIDPPVEEKEVVKCDQCFGYFCYSKTAEYIYGNGCREDLFKSCTFTPDAQNQITAGKNKKACADLKAYPSLFGMCLIDYCNSKTLNKCLIRALAKGSNAKIGEYTYANVTYTQLTTPAPTTTTTTTESSSNSENGNNGNSESDNNGGSGNGNQGNPGTNGSANSKKISVIFFGIFITILILIIFM